jgi:hypothetical protein
MADAAMSTLVSVTWVIGMPGFLARGVLVGDTRITLRDPTGRLPDREIEGVQKVHAISGNIAIGFAGNIDTGLKMVGDARWNIAQAIPPDTMLEQPTRFLLHWRRRLRWAWARLSERERAGDCALLWLGALPSIAPTGMTPTVGWIVRSPDFEPEHIPIGTHGQSAAARR